MASYYKNARRWQRDHQASGYSTGGETITMPRAKDGTFRMAPMRPGGSVPATGNVPQGGISGLPAKPRSDRYWKEYNIPSANRPGGLGRFRGLGGGALGFLMENADEFAKWDRKDWDRFIETGDLPEPFGFLNRKVYPEGIKPLKEPDEKANHGQRDNLGKIWWYDVPPPFSAVCRVHTGYAPGYLDFGRPRLTSGFGHLDYNGGSATGCGSWGGGTLKEGIGYPPVTIHPYWGHYTRAQAAGATDIMWLGFRSPDGTHPTKAPRLLGTTPNMPTVPATWTFPGENKTIPAGDWAVPWSGYAIPDPNVPMRGAMPRNLWNSLKEATGDRWESGYNPDQQPWVRNPTETTTVEVPSGSGSQPPYNPGTVTRPVEPYRPPGKKPDRKAQIYGRGLFAAAQRGFHAITEYGDFIESFYDALPKKYHTCKIGGPACKTAKVLAHWDEVHIPTAVVNWLWNDFEDRMIGKFNKGVGNAAERLGTKDWKLLNGMNESPLDEGLGDLYGEFVKDHVNPTKKDFVAWAERNLF